MATPKPAKKSSKPSTKKAPKKAQLPLWTTDDVRFLANGLYQSGQEGIFAWLSELNQLIVTAGVADTLRKFGEQTGE
jgi:hypothetical protein